MIKPSPLTELENLTRTQVFALRCIAMHTSTGTIIYDPRRPGMRSRTQWWCILNVDDGITDYFRWWLNYEKHLHLQPPSWGAHVSIIRGEKPSPALAHMWKKYHKHKLTFHYDHISTASSARSSRHTQGENSGLFYFIKVHCPELIEIRRELKLPTSWDLHLTIGRTHEYEARKPRR